MKLSKITFAVTAACVLVNVAAIAAGGPVAFSLAAIAFCVVAGGWMTCDARRRESE